MKKITLFAIACLGMSTMVAQTQRTILYEEFTGENCPPCASTNPGIDATINPNFPAKIILLRYQCNIPSAPGVGSLYQDNTAEVGTRQTYYAVPFAPYARFNGIELPDISGGGANNGHAGLITQTHITDSSIVNAPFAIALNHTFNAAADSVTITATVTAAMAYNDATLKLHVSLGESEIHFLSPTGTNGEKDFYHVMRKMIPNASGTVLQTAWTSGASQVFTLKAKVPVYIHDKSKIEIVAFVESDGTSATTRRVHNAAYSAPILFTNDATASVIGSLNPLSCATTVNGVVATLGNTGTNAITSCTVNYKIDAGTPSTTPFTGSIAPGGTATISIPAMTTAAGTHTLYVYTSVPNGSADVNPNNDQTKAYFTIIGAPINAPIVQPFTATAYPPANWAVIDLDHDNIGWKRLTAVGSASGGGASRIYFYNSPPGNIDELYLPYNNLGSSSQLTFYVAGAAYSSPAENDKLEFMVSTDCGTTWNTMYSKSGTTLYTAPTTTTSFAPTTSAQWRMETVSLAAYNNSSNLLMKFKGTSDYGNNVWVDDVNLSTTVGINNHTSNVLFSSVYPNPAQNSVNVLINLSKNENVKVSVLNMLGETVLADTKNLLPGDNNMNLNTSLLASGLYNIVIATAEGTIVHKLTVNN